MRGIERLRDFVKDFSNFRIDIGGTARIKMPLKGILWNSTKCLLEYLGKTEGSLRLERRSYRLEEMKRDLERRFSPEQEE